MHVENNLNHELIRVLIPSAGGYLLREGFVTRNGPLTLSMKPPKVDSRITCTGPLLMQSTLRCGHLVLRCHTVANGESKEDVNIVEHRLLGSTLYLMNR